MYKLHFGDIAIHVSVLCVKQMSKLHFGDIATNVSVYVTKMSMSHVDNIANKILLYTCIAISPKCNMDIFFCRIEQIHV
jgi:hypothetical protein